MTPTPVAISVLSGNPAILTTTANYGQLVADRVSTGVNAITSARFLSNL